MRAFVASVAALLLGGAALPAQAAKAKPDVPGVVYHGPREKKLIALTFDACSSRRGDRVDQAVMDELIALDVPATLFLGGKWMRDDPETVAKLAANPQFELATHSYMHPHLVKMTSTQVQAELQAAAKEFEDVVGRKPALIRAPYGEIDDRVAKLMEADGLTPVQFDLPGADSTFTKKTLVKWVTGQAKPGSIVVLHINGHGKHTAEALPDIVANLRKAGFEFVTVSQLLGRPLPAVDDPLMASMNVTLDEPGPMCSGDDAPAPPRPPPNPYPEVPQPDPTRESP